MKYMIDPDTKKQSVSLTSYVIASVFVISACSIDFIKNGYDPSNFFQLFLATMSLYFGRRFDFSKFSKGSKNNASTIGQSQGQKTSKRTSREIDSGD